MQSEYSSLGYYSFSLILYIWLAKRLMQPGTTGYAGGRKRAGGMHLPLIHQTTHEG